MSKPKKTLDRVLRGDADAGIRFGDLCSLLTHLGFSEQISGGHHIFSREDIEGIINLQPKRGKAKAYQVKQVREILGTLRLVRDPDTEEQTE